MDQVYRQHDPGGDPAPRSFFIAGLAVPTMSGTVAYLPLTRQTVKLAVVNSLMLSVRPTFGDFREFAAEVKGRPWS